MRTCPLPVTFPDLIEWVHGTVLLGGICSALTRIHTILILCARFRNSKQAKSQSINTVVKYFISLQWNVEVRLHRPESRACRSPRLRIGWQKWKHSIEIFSPRRRWSSGSIAFLASGSATPALSNVSSSQAIANLYDFTWSIVDIGYLFSEFAMAIKMVCTIWNVRCRHRQRCAHSFREQNSICCIRLASFAWTYHARIHLSFKYIYIFIYFEWGAEQRRPI